MDIPEDFIEAEIKKILAILEKQCERFEVDKKVKRKAPGTAEADPQVEESEPKHVNR